MADEDTDLDTGSQLEISDEDAERLLADAIDTDDEQPDRRQRTRRGDTERSQRRPRRDEADQDDDSDDEDDGGLGDRGRRALESMKEQRKAARAAERQARTELAEIKSRLEKYENEGKSELQRLQEAAQTGTSRAEKAEAALRRREIAEERAPEHATLTQIKAVAKRLSGGNDDELYDDADELFELLAPEPPKSSARTTRRPEERLQRPRGGVDPEEDDEPNDPRALADLIRNRGR
jgi:murein DD-endopeptidase MepM/ murein hydrolase activator NlpD